MTAAVALAAISLLLAQPSNVYRCIKEQKAAGRDYAADYCLQTEINRFERTLRPARDTLPASHRPGVARGHGRSGSKRAPKPGQP